MSLKAIRIPEKTNILADELSQGWGPTEWSKAPHIVQTIFAMMYFSTINIFATDRNKHFPVYCFRSYVIEKIVREVCRVLLIAPL
jgi:hypothetical protein